MISPIAPLLATAIIASFPPEDLAMVAITLEQLKNATSGLFRDSDAEIARVMPFCSHFPPCKHGPQPLEILRSGCSSAW